jgi:type VI secretion system protein VasD
LFIGGSFRWLDGLAAGYLSHPVAAGRLAILGVTMECSTVTQPGVAAGYRKPIQSRAILRRAALRIALGFGVGASLAVLLGGCASAPEPTLVSGRLQAANDVNPSVSKRPSPLLVRVYELKSATAFNSADFVALFQRDQAELGADLLGREEFMLNPGESRPITKTLAPETRFIGVFAAYRDLERARWRAVVAIEPGKKHNLLVRADELAISAALSN